MPCSRPSRPPVAPAGAGMNDGQIPTASSVSRRPSGQRRREYYLSEGYEVAVAIERDDTPHELLAASVVLGFPFRYPRLEQAALSNFAQDLFGPLPRQPSLLSILRYPIPA